MKDGDFKETKESKESKDVRVRWFLWFPWNPLRRYHTLMPTTGLVLSGGAAWGLANIGVLEVLEREKIRIDCIAGSSMGAIVAGVYALGVPVKDILEVSRQLTVFKIARISDRPLKQGLHGGLFRQQLEDILTPSIGNAQIGDCRMPFVCVAGRVKRPIPWEKIVLPGFADRFFDAVEPYVFPDETRLMDALLASSAIPVAFSPVEIGTDTFIDLVHVGAIPASALQKQCSPDFLIGTDTNPRYGQLQKFLPSGWREYLDRGHEMLEREKALCDVMIEPKLSGSALRFDKAAQFIAAGREAAEVALPALQRILVA